MEETLNTENKNNWKSSPDFCLRVNELENVFLNELINSLEVGKPLICNLNSLYK